MGCGRSKDVGMPDTLENWTMLFDFTHERIQAKPEPASPFFLVLLYEIAEFRYTELKDAENAYNLLDKTLVDFHKAKEELDEREEAEAQARKEKAKQAKKITERELGGDEMDDAIKKKQASRSLKVVVRFLQRKLQIWNNDMKKGKITSTALKNREKYAVVDGDTKKDDDSDDEDEKKGDALTRGWVPGPKESLALDQLDIFLVGDLDSYQLDAGNPLGVFFKLRYGVRLADLQKYEKALEVLQSSYKVSSDALQEQEAEHAAEQKRLAAEGKKPLAEAAAKPADPAKAPRKSKSGKPVERHPLQDLRDVISMSKTKLHKWRIAYDK